LPEYTCLENCRVLFVCLKDVRFTGTICLWTPSQCQQSSSQHLSTLHGDSPRVDATATAAVAWEYWQ